MNKVLDITKKIAVFLRLVDSHDGLLSITNLAIFITLYKLIETPAVSLNDVGMVFVALANYGYKKYINKDVALEILNAATNPAKDDKDA